MSYPYEPPVVAGAPRSPASWEPEPTPPPAKGRALPLVLGILLGLALGAAGGWFAAKSTGAETGAADPVAVATTAPAAAPAASAKAPVAGTKTLKLGQVHSFGKGEDAAAVTALAHKTKDGNEGVQVRTCNTGTKAFTASTIPWLLSYSNGEELIDVTIEGGGLLSPAFVQRDLAPGKCVKGWITFEPPAGGGKPDGVEYRIEGKTSARWEW